MLSVLVYGAETWTLKAEYVQRLTTFRNRYVRTIYLSSYKVPAMGAEADIKSSCQQVWHGLVHIPDIIMDRRLQLLGHLGRMEDERLQKQMLFGELKKKQPYHGVKKRWRDQVSKDFGTCCSERGLVAIYQLC